MILLREHIISNISVKSEIINAIEAAKSFISQT